MDLGWQWRWEVEAHSAHALEGALMKIAGGLDMGVGKREESRITSRTTIICHEVQHTCVFCFVLFLLFCFVFLQC